MVASGAPLPRVGRSLGRSHFCVNAVSAASSSRTCPATVSSILPPMNGTLTVTSACTANSLPPGAVSRSWMRPRADTGVLGTCTSTDPA